MAVRRKYLEENPFVLFEFKEDTKEAEMKVCGKVVAVKKVPLFNETFLKMYFKNEINNYKNTVCPVE